MHKVKDTSLVEKTLIEETIFVGYDCLDYEAIAELVIEDDGCCYISMYNYLDPDSGKWKETEDRDWDKDSIEQTFGVELL